MLYFNLLASSSPSARGSGLESDPWNLTALCRSGSSPLKAEVHLSYLWEKRVYCAFVGRNWPGKLSWAEAALGTPLALFFLLLSHPISSLQRSVSFLPSFFLFLP